MGLSMKMAHYRRDGFNMYTRVLRFLVKAEQRMSGHCDGSGGTSGTGHRY